MGPLWTPYGPPMDLYDPLWTPYVPPMDPLWIPYGHPIWSPNGPHPRVLRLHYGVLCV
jgi:hypothetical protein